VRKHQPRSDRRGCDFVRRRKRVCVASTLVSLQRPRWRIDPHGQAALTARACVRVQVFVCVFVCVRAFAGVRRDQQAGEGCVWGGLVEVVDRCEEDRQVSALHAELRLRANKTKQNSKTKCAAAARDTDRHSVYGCMRVSDLLIKATGPVEQRAAHSTRTRTHMRTHTCTHKHTCTHMHARKHARTSTHGRTRTYARTRTHMRTHMRTRTHARTYAHARARAGGDRPAIGDAIGPLRDALVKDVDELTRTCGGLAAVLRRTLSTHE
jgi:hypothetical protein